MISRVTTNHFHIGNWIDLQDSGTFISDTAWAKSFQVPVKVRK